MDAATRLAEAETQLAAVNAAIAARIADGAIDSYSINGRNIQRARLSELYQFQEKLARTIASLSGVTTVTAEFMRPS